MKKIFLVAATLLVFASTVQAKAQMSKEDIAKLPQDKVEAIRQYCERKWGTNFDMRIFCEDNQFESLKALIDRGSIKMKRVTRVAIVCDAEQSRKL
jgi:hypothetical protein